MTDREKLIELIGSTEYGNGSLIGRNFQSGFIEKIADHLLANGVTFAKDTDVSSKWISVEDRLPEESGMYITAADDGHAKRVTFVKWQKRNKLWELTGARSFWRITHWMPMPEPPKLTAVSTSRH